MAVAREAGSWWALGTHMVQSAGNVPETSLAGVSLKDQLRRLDLLVSHCRTCQDESLAQSE